MQSNLWSLYQLTTLGLTRISHSGLSTERGGVRTTPINGGGPLWRVALYYLLVLRSSVATGMLDTVQCVLIWDRLG